MKIEMSREAGQSLRKSNKRELLTRKIASLAELVQSRNANITRLQGQPGYRLRVQNWRVLFRIEDDTIVVDKVEPRGSVCEDRS